jgi:hypothetical protein
LEHEDFNWELNEDFNWEFRIFILQEQDGLYILDGKRISQLYIPSGKTKKKISKLHGLMNDVCALNVSQNGEKIALHEKLDINLQTEALW